MSSRSKRKSSERKKRKEQGIRNRRREAKEATTTIMVQNRGFRKGVGKATNMLWSLVNTQQASGQKTTTSTSAAMI